MQDAVVRHQGLFAHRVLETFEAPAHALFDAAKRHQVGNDQDAPAQRQLRLDLFAKFPGRRLDASPGPH